MVILVWLLLVLLILYFFVSSGPATYDRKTSDELKRCDDEQIKALKIRAQFDSECG